MLAKGSDVNLKRLAKSELAASPAAAQTIAVADGWWDFAGKSSETERVEVLAHAAALYKRAVDNATGLQRRLVERRIADADAAQAKSAAEKPDLSGRIVHLLPLIDPDKDTVQGKFVFRDSVLFAEGEGEQRIEIPYHPPAEYDFRVEFVRVSGDQTIVQILSEGQVPFIWLTGSQYQFHYLIKGDAFGIPSKGKPPTEMTNGVRYLSTVKVRKSGVEASLNGNPIAYWKTDYTDINPDIPFWALRDKSLLGLGVGGSKVAFRAVDVVELSDKGSRSR